MGNGLDFDVQHMVVDRQKGTPSLRPVEPYRARRISQIARANWLRRSGGVARIISTAAPTDIAWDCPFMLVTAVNHWPTDSAP